eukprot:m51a1_g2102 hypothetical protein (719) ;mRNA; r:1596629-1599305
MASDPRAADLPLLQTSWTLREHIVAQLTDARDLVALGLAVRPLLALCVARVVQRRARKSQAAPSHVAVALLGLLEGHHARLKRVAAHAMPAALAAASPDDIRQLRTRVVSDIVASPDVQTRDLLCDLICEMQVTQRYNRWSEYTRAARELLLSESRRDVAAGLVALAGVCRGFAAASPHAQGQEDRALWKHLCCVVPGTVKSEIVKPLCKEIKKLGSRDCHADEGLQEELLVLQVLHGIYSGWMAVPPKREKTFLEFVLRSIERPLRASPPTSGTDGCWECCKTGWAIAQGMHFFDCVTSMATKPPKKSSKEMLAFGRLAIETVARCAECPCGGEQYESATAAIRYLTSAVHDKTLNQELQPEFGALWGQVLGDLLQPSEESCAAMNAGSLCLSPCLSAVGKALQLLVVVRCSLTDEPDPQLLSLMQDELMGLDPEEENVTKARRQTAFIDLAASLHTWCKRHMGGDIASSIAKMFNSSFAFVRVSAVRCYCSFIDSESPQQYGQLLGLLDDCNASVSAQTVYEIRQALTRSKALQDAVNERLPRVVAAAARHMGRGVFTYGACDQPASAPAYPPPPAGQYAPGPYPPPQGPQQPYPAGPYPPQGQQPYPPAAGYAAPPPQAYPAGPYPPQGQYPAGPYPPQQQYPQQYPAGTYPPPGQQPYGAPPNSGAPPVVVVVKEKKVKEKHEHHSGVSDEAATCCACACLAAACACLLESMCN